MLTEAYKDGVHRAMFGLAVAMFLYNLGERNILNTIVYGGLMVVEWVQADKHR